MNRVHIDFPFSVDSRGRSAVTDHDDFVRDMIEQLLLTSPGERVNRPEFGSGLMQLVHAPNSPELATALQTLIQAALQRWLGDLVEVQSVEAESHESTIRITVRYVVRRTGSVREATFSRAV